MSLLPSRPDTSAADEAAPTVVGVDSERADALMAALASGTARDILATLHEEPGPPSALAERVGTSLQNAQYHLERLEDAGAVEVVDTAYSEKGREMDIYAPADRPLVIFAGRDDQSRSLRAAIRELIAGVAGLALVSLAIQEAFGRSVTTLFGAPGGESADDGGAAGGGMAPPETATPTPTRQETATSTSQPAAPGPTEAAGGTPTPEAGAVETLSPTITDATQTAVEGAGGAVQVPPGLLFFLGGLLVLVVVVALVR